MRHEEIKIRLNVIINNQNNMMNMMRTTINIARRNSEYLSQIAECEIESVQYQREQLYETQKMGKNISEINRHARETAFYSEVSAFCDVYSTYKMKNI